MNDHSIHQGRCLCGRYHFRVEGNPLWVAYCHCESCRRFNGSPTAAYVGYRKGSVQFDPDVPPWFTSSPEVQRSFCERCSTPLAYAAEWFPDEIHLFRSTFDQPETFEPTRHVLFNEHEADHDIYDDLPRYGEDPGRTIGWGPRPAIRVLFLCTGNSARSILAEAIVNLRNALIAGKRVRAHSAGSRPTGTVNPGALALVDSHAYRLDHLRSKSWDEFVIPTAPPVDWVITLCDSARGESCPVFQGAANRRHWGLADPAESGVSFEETWRAIEERVDAFLDAASN